MMSEVKNMTLKETSEILNRVFDKLSDHNAQKREYSCAGVRCRECCGELGIIFEGGKTSCIEQIIVSDPNRASELLEKWNNEHPFVTNQMKFKEMVKQEFGLDIKRDLTDDCPPGCITGHCYGRGILF